MYEKRLLEIGESIVKSIDNLASTIKEVNEEANIEIEPTPPKCPHCNDINPVVKTEAQEASEGALLDLVLDLTCMKCKNKFYVLITGWAICNNVKDAQMNGRLIMERVMGSGGADR